MDEQQPTRQYNPSTIDWHPPLTAAGEWEEGMLPLLRLNLCGRHSCTKRKCAVNAGRFWMNTICMTRKHNDHNTNVLGQKLRSSRTTVKPRSLDEPVTISCSWEAGRMQFSPYFVFVITHHYDFKAQQNAPIVSTPPRSSSLMRNINRDPFPQRKT